MVGFRFRCGLMLTLCATGCVYPVRGTPLSAVPRARTSPGQSPDHMWHLTLVRAHIPPDKRGAVGWDDDGSGPDAYFILKTHDQERWRSPVVEDSTQPQFDASPPDNLRLDRHGRVRLELWDRDGLLADPIGIHEGRALSEALLDSDTTIALEGGATVTLRISHPLPKVGTGIPEYESRPDALLIHRVLDQSPAARAGLRPGDSIIAINGATIRELGAAKAESALALAFQQDTRLTVQRGKQTSEVTLDHDYVWSAL